MLNLDKNIKITRKNFEFPLSIKAFTIDEATRVATYTYAGMDWALHERVMQYRTITMSGSFSSDSGSSYGWWTPSEWIIKLQKLNNNKPWLLTHSILWTYTCIIHDLKITHNWDNVEPTSDNYPIPNFDFEIEFWEHFHSNFNEDLEKFRPAILVRPPNDLYSVTLKYTTCEALYKAILDWLIAPWTDPIVNAEWLKYDIGLRTCAYGKRITNPNWENTWYTFDAHGNIVANPPKATTTAGETTNWNIINNQSLYKVLPWETAVIVAKKLRCTVEALMAANKNRDVTNLNLLHPWKYYCTRWNLHAW